MDGFSTVQKKLIHQVSAPITNVVNQSSKTNVTTITQHETQDIRNAYLQMIEDPNWKALLIETGKQIKNGVETSTESTQMDVTLYYCMTGHVDGTTNTLQSEIITVGKKTGVDVCLPDDAPGVSRLHMIIFQLSDKIIVVDPGSLFGVQTILRSSDKPLEHSVPTQRKVLIFDKDETVTFRIGDYELTISPKMCIICYENPRTIRLTCGHLVCCETCHEVIKQQHICPICKKYINDGHIVQPVKTYVLPYKN